MDGAAHPLVTLIAAVASNRVIGRQGRLPWRIPDDMARFRALTMGHPVIMGRATWESLARPLAGRTNIVLTRTPGRAMTGALVAHGAEAALAAAGDAAEVFVIGGAAVYELFLPRAGRLAITWVEAEVEGDSVFPPVAWDEWEIVTEAGAEAAPGVLPHRFVDYRRIPR